MYLWKIEYNLPCIRCNGVWLWIALNYVSLKDWIQSELTKSNKWFVVNCFKLCIFERLNTIWTLFWCRQRQLWIALNYVSLKDWIQFVTFMRFYGVVVNCFKLCIFERLNTMRRDSERESNKLWIALNYVSLKDWIQ